MNNLLLYLVELNMAMVIFYVAYKLIFDRDKNFITRRVYLFAAMILSILIPLIPQLNPVTAMQVGLLTIHLEGVTVTGSGSGNFSSFSLPWAQWLGILYLGVILIGVLRLMVQLVSIFLVIHKSEKQMLRGIPILSSRRLHASSFFGFIFIDSDGSDDESVGHILDHENIHKKEWHSIDRIFVELFVLISWFNPVAWMLRRSVIENLEYLADSVMVRNGTDPVKYQLSILNQYIGSAFITNQFSSQIKNRINMLNRDYKLGSGWKLAILFPLIFIALIIVSCTETDNSPAAASMPEDETAIATLSPELEGGLFYVVEEMPTFNGGDAAVEFRKYIAQNIRYPKEAAENGVTGKIFIHFVVTKEGKVVVPDEETMARMEGKSLDEVVVVAYRSLKEGGEIPEDQYIQMLKDEVVRLVSSSPDWKPGKQDGKAVNVSYTFPVNFVLQ